MPRWEYRIELINTLGCYLVDKEHYPVDKILRAKLAFQAQWKPINDLGEQGWEMVSASWQGDEGIAVFKRELSERLVKIVSPPEELTEDGEPVQARKGLEAMKRRFRDGRYNKG